ncbi:hypothetical protein [Chamaesiphon sp. VAR_48_metabat_403]|uniref:hypothetical protein n=1 Tax=Chamaesiphon sp. VAR_48_metabat_403 TaxID=2964700 RepID=UPI00286DCAD6|nr:hypothetical protein [Chamaesiphon sp. VAR_48_metabat_403]
MTNSSPLQLSLIAELDAYDFPVGDWDYDELGTEIFLVPNSPIQKLGTEISLVPNSDNWQPPIGGFEQKWIKDHQYWYWRYYDNRGKKRSLYLAKDYNKAIRKAIKIGVPTDAKLPNLSASHSQGEAQKPTTDNLIPIPTTAHGTPRNSRAA